MSNNQSNNRSTTSFENMKYEIAKELGLTQEEVDYIHEEMKDFGYKARKQV